MTTAITTFDPSSFADRIREKIKGALLDLIPEEQWQALIKKEVADYFVAREVKRNIWDSSYTTAESYFAMDVRKCIQEETTKRMATFLSGPDFFVTQDGGTYVFSETVKQMAIKAAPEIVAKLMQTFIDSAVQGLRNSIR